MLGLVVAMENEAVPFIKLAKREETHFGKKFFFMDIEGTEAVLVLCGIGKVNAAFGTTLLIEKYRPELLINFGVSGGLKEGLKHLDLVAVTAAVQHDADTSEFGDPKGLVCTVNTVFFNADKKCVEILKKIDGIKSGVAACGDQFVANKERKDEIVSLFDAVICDMESGAVAHCALMAGIKFAAVRCVSDVGSDSAVGEYREFMPKASGKMCSAVSELIKGLREAD